MDICRVYPLKEYPFAHKCQPLKEALGTNDYEENTREVRKKIS